VGEPAGGQRRHFLLQAQRKKKPISLKFSTPIDGNKRATGVEQQTFVCFSQLLFLFVRPRLDPPKTPQKHHFPSHLHHIETLNVANDLGMEY